MNLREIFGYNSYAAAFYRTMCRYNIERGLSLYSSQFLCWMHFGLNLKKCENEWELWVFFNVDLTSGVLALLGDVKLIC